MEEEAIRFYKDLFSSESVPTIAACHKIAMPMLCDKERLSLVTPVNKDEVKRSIMSMHSFKALGSDGFQAFFYKQFWDIIGDDVWRLLQVTFAKVILILL